MSLSNTYEGRVLLNLLFPSNVVESGGIANADLVASGVVFSDTGIPKFSKLYMGLSTVALTGIEGGDQTPGALKVAAAAAEPVGATSPTLAYAQDTNYMRMPLDKCDFDAFFQANPGQTTVGESPIVPSTTASIAFYKASFANILTGAIQVLANSNRIVFPTAKGAGWGDIKSWFITPCADFDFGDTGVPADLRDILVWGDLNSTTTIATDDQGIFNANAISINID